MKIPKKGLLIIVVGIPLILLGGLVMARSQQFEEQSKLRSELPIARQRLASLQAERQSPAQNGTEKQISDTLRKVDIARTSLSPNISSIVVDDRLLAIARSCGVTVKQIDVTGPNNHDLYGIKSSAIAITMVAEGELDNLLDFVCKLNEGQASGNVESVNISLRQGAEDNFAEAKVQFNLATYKGS